MSYIPLVIIWTGSAGLPAGMYASRYKIDNVIIGKDLGGALATSHCVENWPGVLSASGREIMESFAHQAEQAGSRIVRDTVISVREVSPHEFEVRTEQGQVWTCSYILLATGNVYRKLNIPGEKELLGSGVSYCATCDGNFFRNKTVAIVGGGDTAFTEALYLAELCSKVYVLVRTARAKAENIWQEKVQHTPNIEVIYDIEVQEIQGKFQVEKLRCNQERVLEVSGIFVAIGSDPNISLVAGFGLKKDSEGCIVVDARQQTSHSHIYAAGDVTTNSNKFKQTIMSAAEGCLAAHSIHEDILKSSSHD